MGRDLRICVVDSEKRAHAIANDCTGVTRDFFSQPSNIDSYACRNVDLYDGCYGYYEVVAKIQELSSDENIQDNIRTVFVWAAILMEMNVDDYVVVENN